MGEVMWEENGKLVRKMQEERKVSKGEGEYLSIYVLPLNNNIQVYYIQR